MNEITSLFQSLRLDECSSKQIHSKSKSIISKSLLDMSKSSHRKTGLVIGYIQSGKTLSFTAVSCLARDKKFSLIIITAGTSKILFQQTLNRLKKDLRIDSRTDRKWIIFENPKPSTNEEQSIENTLRTWQDESIPFEEKKTILIVTMKHHRHIEYLSNLLDRMDSDLKKIQSLIIDDEADQAGLNTNANQDTEELSTTYKQLSTLRNTLPYHTYLQYTATPQALLLIELSDHLSPDFIELLTPGEEYVGGRELFSQSGIIIPIPHDEVPKRDEPLLSPPSSLLKALRVFYVSVSIAYYRRETQGNRSMMVHPSRLTRDHSECLAWIISTREQWLGLLNESSDSQDQCELMRYFEEEGYSELRKTVDDLPKFSKIKSYLKRSIQETLIVELNASSGVTPQVEWQSNYSHILVGGQALDRGYTVEGLTVTYMSRGLGVGNADTIQQRARFYGYKKDYLSYCRIFLEENALNAFEGYVEHEDSLRVSLEQHISAGRPLSDWRRVFFLDSNLRPTRRNVLTTDCQKGLYSNKWFWQKTPLVEDSIINCNRQIISDMIGNLPFLESDGHPDRTDTQKHLIASNLPLKRTI